MGIVPEDDDHDQAQPTTAGSSSSWLASLGFGGGSAATPTATPYTPPTLTIAYAPAGSTTAPELLTMVVKPALTLKDLYAATATRFGLNGAPASFSICMSSTRTPIRLSDLHGPHGSLVSAYVDTTQQRTGVDDEKPLPVPPGPSPRLIGRNADDLQPNPMVASLRLMKQYGPVFRLSLPAADEAIFVADPDIAEQVLTRPEIWGKVHMKNLKFARAFLGNGLFTSDDDEPIWDQAHRILLPAFSNTGMKGPYFVQVQEAVAELFNKWDALAASGAPIDLTEWSERFTFDVIGRVAFNQSFDAIQNGTHPYLETMAKTSAVAEELRTFSFIQTVLQTPSLIKTFQTLNKKNIDFVHTIVAKRKAELEQGVEPNRTDLLTLMLQSKDPRTGECLPADNVVFQILTFLFAGHDSTSTAITTLFMNVAMHGEVERRIVEEVERVVGTGPLTFDKLGKLEYCTAVINESMRLFPPAQMIRKTASEEVHVGPYVCSKGTAALVSLWGVSHNPHAWPDPWRFDPDRWLGARAKDLHPFASLPFSYGPRACIGRQLSIMEQRSILVQAVRRYHLRLHSRAHPYITTPAFIKPRAVLLNLELKATPTTTSASTPTPTTTTTAATATATSPSIPTPAPAQVHVQAHVQPNENSHLLVLFGSNLGTCEAYAAEVAHHARVVTRLPCRVVALDELIATAQGQGQESVVKQAVAVIIICSTYNGTPPDNATAFMRVVESKPSELGSLFSGVPFAVFGAGNSQWARTYQGVPTTIDAALEAAGGVRLLEFSCGDADVDLDESLDEWKRRAVHTLHTTLLGGDSTLAEDAEVSSAVLAPAFTLEPAPNADAAAAMQQVANDFARRNGLFLAKLASNEELQDTSKSQRSTRHIEIELPAEASYSAGDHLAVYPGNAQEVVERAAAAVGVGLEDVYKVKLASSTDHAVSSIIPLDVPLTVKMILTWCVELQQPATRHQISYIATRTPCPPEKAALEALLSAYDTEVLKARRTALQLLDEYKSAKLSLPDLLTILPPMKVRYYSISSSPKPKPGVLSITVGVVKGTSSSGREHVGVCSNFLARRGVGEPLRAFIKDTKSSFRLPPDGSTPIILVGPGTGLAPLRGFLQDREASGATGKALLFFGCRNDADYIYRAELEGFLSRGVLTALHVAYSRPTSATATKTYVQHMIQAKAEEVSVLLKAGAHVYVCGDAKFMAPDVRQAIGQILAGGSADKAACHARVEAMVSEARYHEDVWAS